MNKNDLLDSIPRQSYIPILLDTSSSQELAPSKTPIATHSAPEQICGMARRIGYTASSRNAFALYRIKAQVDHKNSYVTLPSIFVLVDGIFLDYQEWSNSIQA